ncbi:MAG: ribosome silencing factor [Pseudomonadota bacterium]|nr:ribosome silencing factor [Pseudomonadota bacterium]MDE3038028.1 ribosome silencing factor [Pseudomonadota bacterium]
MSKSPTERRTAIVTKKQFPKPSLPHLERLILSSLDQQKAENIVSVDLTGKSDFADRMVIASGTSQRHVSSLADRVIATLKGAGYHNVPTEGQGDCDWVLVDAGNIVVHIFRPEARRYYNLEKMWSVDVPRLEAVY